MSKEDVVFDILTYNDILAHFWQDVFKNKQKSNLTASGYQIIGSFGSRSFGDFQEGVSLILAQSCSCIEPSLAFAIGTILPNIKDHITWII